MRKLIIFLITGILWCNVGFAKPIFLNCKDNEKLSTEEWVHEFISLDFDNKKYLWEGKSVVKGNDISKGKIIMKETIELPLIKEDSEVLALGWDFMQNDKRNFDI